MQRVTSPSRSTQRAASTSPIGPALTMAGGGKSEVHRGRRVVATPRGVGTGDTALGQVDGRIAVAVDTAGNLYVVENVYDYATSARSDRIRKRDAQGNWAVVATFGSALGQVNRPNALAVDTAGSLYVADYS